MNNIDLLQEQTHTISSELCYFLGIDGGGSKCKVRLEDQFGNILSEYRSGPANPMRDFEIAKDSIECAISGVFVKAKLPTSAIAKTHAAIGLAGLNIPQCMERMKKWDHPFASLNLSSDLLIACAGAHGSSNGAIVIIGTGSSGLVCKGEEHFEYGGHGFLLGDKGSGAWFGAQCIRYMLESIDGVASSSQLINTLLEKSEHENAHAIVEYYATAAPAEFAVFAPLVFEFADKKDEVALKIVKEGARYIDKLCNEMMKHSPERFAFIGGLAHKLIPWLSTDIQKSLCEPLYPPEVGAVLIARQKLALKGL